jgi:hypothetical protein
MRNQTVFTISLLVIIGLCVLFTINISSIMKGKNVDETYVKYNGVRGMAIEHNKLLYTLNFDQQNDVIGMLNRSVRVVGVKPDKRQKPDIEKLVIYQFGDKPDIIITPIAYINNNLVYSAPAWNVDNYLMELSDGGLQKLIAQTYDQ